MKKICVLQPDYSASEIDYRHYDPPRNLAELLPGVRVDHVLLDKRSTYRQLQGLKKAGYDIFINLCEGYLDWDVPSIDVVYALEWLGLPYTGPGLSLYDPSKTLMKYVAYTAGVSCPPWVELETAGGAEAACAGLRYPLFVKPARAGDSLGVNARSLVRRPEDLREQVASLLEQYESVLVEEYIAGREFTVLVAAGADPDQPPLAFRPLEFVFPEGEQFKTYELKVRQWRPECNVPCTDPALDTRLREAACQVFQNFGGQGYARLDFRLDDAGNLFFLEINFTCSVFYPEGSEGSADYILKFDGLGQAGFLQHIIAEGLARHQRRQPAYQRRSKGIDGYGIFARRPIRAGEVVWAGEERAQRIATRRHVGERWPPEAQANFRRYAYPISEEVYVLWDENPDHWAPQNHSCAPNTTYRGLDVVALCDIAAGAELTLDYAAFLDEQAEPFDCRCGAPNCRGRVAGTPGNSVTFREKLV